MKKIILSAMIGTLFFHQKTSGQELRSDFLFELNMVTSSPQVVGPVFKGTRLIIPYKGGLVKGEKINGKILDCSGDWGLLIDSTTFRTDVRATIETDDGAHIFLTSTGYNFTDAKGFTMISTGRGGELSPSDYYFRTNITFEASSPKYAWLNHSVAIGVGRFVAADKVDYRVYVIK
jgi:hypothetical protein